MSFITNALSLCNFPGPTYLLFSNNVPPLVYYSHLPVILISLLLGFFVFKSNSKSLQHRLLFLITILFSFWVFLDSIFWASNRSDVIMFVWSLTILFEPLVYICMLYLAQVLVNKEDISFREKLLIFLVYLPVILFIPTRYFLSGFDLSSCLAVETNFSFYSYAIEIFYTVWLIIFSVHQYITEKNVEIKQEILYLTTGSLLLLLSFSSGNIISSFTEDWNYAQIGLFAMPVFIAFLVYSIVRFKTFNIKLIATQAFIAALNLLIASQFFFIQVTINKILTGITLAIAMILGINLIKSVKKEIESRERIEKLAGELETANTQLVSANEKLEILDRQKSEFVSIASHQLRSPLTVIKGYLSMFTEGEPELADLKVGTITMKGSEVLNICLQSANRLVRVIEDFLNVSRIEQGRMRYEVTEFDLREMVIGVVAELKTEIEQKKLTFNFTDVTPTADYKITADSGKIRQVITNLVDNSVKYTRQGGIILSLELQKSNKFRIAITDTGIGISKENLKNLFQKFSRAGNGSKENVTGSGLGLFVALDIVKAHKGKIWAESPGEGKGSTFYIELPRVKV